MAILWPYWPEIIWPQAVPATPNGLGVGWTWLNIVLHIWGGEFGPLWPPKNGILGPQNPPKSSEDAFEKVERITVWKIL